MLFDLRMNETEKSADFYRVKAATVPSPFCLSRYEGQVLVGFGFGNEEPSE